MNKQSNSYTILYSTILVLLVAIVLSYTALQLSPIQKANVEIEKKGNILESVGLLKTYKDMSKDKSIEKDYKEFVKGTFLVNRKGDVVSTDEKATFTAFINLNKEYAKPKDEQQLPLFVVNVDGAKIYVFPVEGMGLWGPVWGYIALNSDLSTIYGVVFDHKSETPGLGAEIRSKGFTEQFKGKTLFNGDDYIGIKSVKGTAEGNIHEIDAISGGTITTRSVEDMINNNISAYKAYILNNRAKQEVVINSNNSQSQGRLINNL